MKESKIIKIINTFIRLPVNKNKSLYITLNYPKRIYNIHVQKNITERDKKLLNLHDFTKDELDTVVKVLKKQTIKNRRN